MENYFSIAALYDILGIPKLYNISPIYKYFGLFVTVDKGDNGIVHGCMGYWDNKLGQIDKGVLNSELRKCAYRAAYEDSRNTDIKILYNNRLASIDVSLMLFDSISKISSTGVIESTKEQFTNDKWGLIVYNGDTPGATYLPGIFPGMSWIDIKKSVIEKARLGDNKRLIFYAYMTLVEKINLNNIFSINPKVIQLLAYSLKWIDKHSKEDVVFSVSNGKPVYKPDEGVRNLSTVYCLLCNGYGGYERIVLDYGKRDDLSSLPYLVLCYKQLGDMSKVDNLLVKLERDIDKLEERFQKGQGLMAMKLLGNDIDGYISSDLEYIGSKIERKLDNIFYINWILHWYSGEVSNSIVDYIDWIYDKLDDKLETNYWVVLFEAISYIIHWDHDKYMAMLSYIFINLQLRLDRVTGLYRFINGDIRVDITIHVLTGLDRIANNK